MATGVQAAALCKSKEGEKTSLDMCVHGIVYEVLNPLGVPAPQTSYIPTFLASPLVKQVGDPFIGCVARWPRDQGYQHVSMITAMSGDQLYETSFGTGSGVVRGYWYPKDFFESFWSPSYDGTMSTADTANLASTTETASAFSSVGAIGTFLSDVSSPSFWVRVGVGALGVTLLGIALIKLLSSTQVGQTAISTAKKAAEVAALT